MTSTAAFYGREYAPTALRLPLRPVNWSYLLFMGAASIAAVSWMSATLTTVGTMGDMASALHASAYDAGLTPRPLPNTLPLPKKPTKFERVAFAEPAVDNAALTAEAVRSSYFKVTTAAALAGEMRDAFEFLQDKTRVALAPLSARIVAEAADLPRTAGGNVDFALLGRNLRFALAHDPQASSEVRQPSAVERVAEAVPTPTKRPRNLLPPPVVEKPVADKPATAVLDKPVASRTIDVAAPARPAKSAEPEVRMASIAPPVVRQEAPPVVQPSLRPGVAIYDLGAGVVYLPSGERLEAHSGIGPMRDNIRFIHVKMRGPTPPATYNLTMRESLFHGVEAIRLNPVGGVAPMGRTGILAHTYMLRMPGDSNGCVVFKDYKRFLSAFKRGEIRQMVVVPSLRTRVAGIF